MQAFRNAPLFPNKKGIQEEGGGSQGLESSFGAVNGPCGLPCQWLCGKGSDVTANAFSFRAWPAFPAPVLPSSSEASSFSQVQSSNAQRPTARCCHGNATFNTLLFCIKSRKDLKGKGKDQRGRSQCWALVLGGQKRRGLSWGDPESQ